MSEQWAVIAELGDHPILAMPGMFERLVATFSAPVPLLMCRTDSPCKSGHPYCSMEQCAFVMAIRIQDERLMGLIDPPISAPLLDHLHVVTTGTRLVEVFVGSTRRPAAKPFNPADTAASEQSAESEE